MSLNGYVARLPQKQSHNKISSTGISNPPSVKLLIAIRFGDSAIYFKVTSPWPSLIIRWTMMRALNTIVHVESRTRSVSVRKTSATPASPPLVALSIASTYFDFGAASCSCLSPHMRAEEYSAHLYLCCTLHNLVHDAVAGPRQLFNGVQCGGCRNNALCWKTGRVLLQ